MIDFFDISNNNNTQVFYNQGSGSTVWQTWQKPKNCKLIQIITIGGGAGGGGGRSSNVNYASGGGGGGSSSVTTGVFQSNLLPDTLYISVGRGGLGGGVRGNSNGVGGGGGTISIISISPTALTSTIVLASGTISPTGGGGGTLGPGGTGTAGTAGSVFSQTNGLFSLLGIINTIIGQNGTLGVDDVQPNSVTVTGITSGGAAGGGADTFNTSYNGGFVIGNSFIPTASGGTFGLGSNATNGLPGFNSTPYLISSKYPFITTGGGGGGGATDNALGTFTGGVGGNGGYGSGGGGGGGSYDGVAGRGGNGGDGLVIITSW